MEGGELSHVELSSDEFAGGEMARGGSSKMPTPESSENKLSDLGEAQGELSLAEFSSVDMSHVEMSSESEVLVSLSSSQRDIWYQFCKQ